MSEHEEQAGEDAQRILTLIEAGRRGELSEFVAELDRDALGWVAFALAQALLIQESENDRLVIRQGVVQAQNEMLENANKSLFKERGELITKNGELRSLLDRRASEAPLGSTRGMR